MISRKIFLLLFITLGPMDGAYASVPEDTTIEEDALAPLAQWVERAMQVPIAALPITVASGRRLKMSLGLKGVQQARAIAAYLPGQIVINNTIWDPDSVAAKSYLVHELVHHAQLIGERKYSCEAAKEREAYALQNRWLGEHGVPPLVPQEWIDANFSCPH